MKNEKKLSSRLSKLGIAATLSALALLASLSISCTAAPKNSTTSEAGPSVYCTVYPVYDFVKILAPDKVDVRLLLPVGADAHEWEPSPKDMVGLNKTRALIANGAGMEPWLDTVKSNLPAEVVIVDSSVGLHLMSAEAHEAHEEHTEKANEQEHQHKHGSYDPHIWLSPKNAGQQVENIAAALIKLFPQDSAEIESKLTAARTRLSELDKSYDTALAPYKGQTILIGHEAFGYMCANYGLEQQGIEGLLSSTEPGPAKMAQLVDLARSKGIKCVFVDPAMNNKASLALAKELGGEVLPLDPFGNGPTKDVDAAQYNYFSVMEKNLQNLLKGLALNKK